MTICEADFPGLGFDAVYPDGAYQIDSGGNLVAGSGVDYSPFTDPDTGQVIVYGGKVRAGSPPFIAICVPAGTYEIAVSNNIAELNHTPVTLSLWVDGVLQTPDFDSGTGTISCNLPLSSGCHRLLVSSSIRPFEVTMSVQSIDVVPPVDPPVLVASAVKCFGQVSSAVPGTMSFTPTAGADMIVAALCWEKGDPFAPPVVSIGGLIFQVVTSPVLENGADPDNHGAIALYVLKLDAPVSGAATVTVDSAPNYAGYTSIALYAFSNAAGLVGGMVTDIYGTHDAGVNTGTSTISGSTDGTLVCWAAGTIFGNEPATVTPSAGWSSIGHDSALHQSMWGFSASSTAAGDHAITMGTGSDYVNLMVFGFEVLPVGSTAPDSSVTVTAAELVQFGAIGLDTVTRSVNLGGAELAVFAIARTNNQPAGPASWTYGGKPLTFLSAFAAVHADTGTVVDVAFVADPPSGAQDLVGTGRTGYFGYTEVAALGVAGVSGVIGVRKVQLDGGHGADLGLSASTAGSRLVAFVATIFPRGQEVASYGWRTLAHDDTDAAIDWSMFTAVGGASTKLLLAGLVYSTISTIVLEFLPTIATSPNITATGADQSPAPAIAGTATNRGKLTPAGQDFHVYLETWLDVPLKDRALLQPDDFYLARLPGYVGSVLVSFAVPQCTYGGLDSDMKATVGLNFPGNGHLFKRTLDLLRARSPGVKVYLAVQQNTPEQAYNEPYDTVHGWAGMTNAHVSSIARVLEDFGMAGVVIDYEVLSANNAPEFHCVRDLEAGTVACYTDAELVNTIKKLRDGLPRPIELILDGQHVGAYGVGDYQHAKPDGFNSGYDWCVSQDPVALAALDAIHVMTYDAGAEYDPRIAVRAYKALFPDVPIYLGLRVGPPQYQNVKQTAADIRDYCNTVIMLGLAGVHMYSAMWDVVRLGRERMVLDNDPPFGAYGPDFPDGNIAAAVVCDVFNLGTEDAPAGSGYSGPVKGLRLDNRPPSSPAGLFAPSMPRGF